MMDASKVPINVLFSTVMGHATRVSMDFAMLVESATQGLTLTALYFMCVILVRCWLKCRMQCIPPQPGARFVFVVPMVIPNPNIKYIYIHTFHKLYCYNSYLNSNNATKIGIEHVLQGTESTRTITNHHRAHVQVIITIGEIRCSANDI
jgi:hypothetical protein